MSKREGYAPAADHAVILYQTVDKMQHMNDKYSFSMKWFLKVQQTSIENSNKCKVLDKRLRYIKDHLTYTLYKQVSFSTFKADKLTFAFFLSCQLLIEDGKLDKKALNIFPPLFESI